MSIAGIFVIVHLLSSVQLFETPWTAAHLASLSFTIYQSLLKLMSIESVMPSNHLILCHPLLLLPSIFPSILVVSKELTPYISWSKYWSFSFSISPPKEYSVLISFRIDFGFVCFCFPRCSQEPSPTPQCKSISSSESRLHYGLTLTSIHNYWKNHIFQYKDFGQQSDVSAFQYTVWVCHSFSSKEQASFDFLAAVAICNDFRAQENKVCHCFHCFPIYLS